MQPAPVAEPVAEQLTDQLPEQLSAPTPDEPAPAGATVHEPGSLRAVGPVTPTGPIAGLPDRPPPAPSAPRAVQGRQRRRVAHNVHLHPGVAGPALAVVAVVLLELGLLVHEGGRSVWSRSPLWAAFATLAAVVGLTAFAAPLPGLRRLGSERAWGVAAGGLCGLAAFWLLVALPTADTDRGFLLTAALACLGAALWTAPGRSPAVSAARRSPAPPVGPAP
jgi:hypothetical protein